MQPHGRTGSPHEHRPDLSRLARTNGRSGAAATPFARHHAASPTGRQYQTRTVTLDTLMREVTDRLADGFRNRPPEDFPMLFSHGASARVGSTALNNLFGVAGLPSYYQPVEGHPARCARGQRAGRPGSFRRRRISPYLQQGNRRPLCARRKPVQPAATLWSKPAIHWIGCTSSCSIASLQVRWRHGSTNWSDSRAGKHACCHIMSSPR